MASKTGIALLSVYDDEDDDDMEDLNEEQQQEDQQDEDMEQNYEEDDSILKADKNALIVDYGRDEVAMSPEAELEEEAGIVRAVSLSTQTTFQSSVYVETSQTVTMHITVRDSDTMEDVDDRTISGVASKDVDPLDDFFPSPQEEKCSDELQDRIYKFLALKGVGKSFNAEVRNKKNYRNPDFLLHAVRYQDIDQIGSCFSKDVFDPHGYDKSDYYDEIEADMKHEAERKEQERKKSPKVEFHAGGMHLGTVPTYPTAQKVGLSASGVSTGGASGLPSVPVAVDAVNQDGRKNKKSKWDKVDGDRRNFLPSKGKDPLSYVGAPAANLSASNATAGYIAFAQQRRREAEDKRSSERRR